MWASEVLKLSAPFQAESVVDLVVQVALRRIHRPLLREARVEGGPSGAGYLLDIIAEEAFDPTGGPLQAVIKADAFRKLRGPQP